MSNLDNTYIFEQKDSVSSIRYLFVSKGQTDVVKAVDIAPLGKFNDRTVYNFGFGDYDMEQDGVLDNVNTNNGDPYKVFNTVLNTIAHFFETYSEAMIMVQGSDSHPDFAENCKLTCTKKCDDNCKNANRRISIYRKYVNKNYHELSTHYQFLGGYFNPEKTIVVEDYIPDKEYNSVFLFKRKV